jgi:hypothetical protein
MKNKLFWLTLRYTTIFKTNLNINIQLIKCIIDDNRTEYIVILSKVIVFSMSYFPYAILTWHLHNRSVYALVQFVKL